MGKEGVVGVTPIKDNNTAGRKGKFWQNRLFGDSDIVGFAFADLGVAWQIAIVI